MEEKECNCNHGCRVSILGIIFFLLLCIIGCVYALVKVIDGQGIFPKIEFSEPKKEPKKKGRR